MITFERSPISQMTCYKNPKFHATTFVYWDGTFVGLHGESGGSAEIVARKLDRWEKAFKYKPREIIAETKDELPF